MITFSSEHSALANQKTVATNLAPSASFSFRVLTGSATKSHRALFVKWPTARYEIHLNYPAPNAKPTVADKQMLIMLGPNPHTYA